MVFWLDKIVWEQESKRVHIPDLNPYKQRKWFPGNESHMKALQIVSYFL